MGALSASPPALWISGSPGPLTPVLMESPERRPPSVLLAPQELKGSLTAVQAAEAIARGIRRAAPRVGLDLAPLADGGPGTVDAILGASRGERRSSQVSDPLGRPVAAGWALIDEGRTAVVEMAQASGLGLLREEEREPLRANTAGTGELIRVALDAGCERILVGAGGSATTDGGVGAAHVLGVRFLDGAGERLPPEPRFLSRLARIDLASRDRRLARARLLVLTDVRNPLCGREGAAQIYGPQKGADPRMAAELDRLLGHLAGIVRVQLGIDLQATPGAGAAGGLPFGLAACCGAEIVSGFEMISAALGLDSRVQRADWVITAEGRLDAQSAYFKGPYALGRLARARGKPVVLFTGAVSEPTPREAFDQVIAVTPPGMSWREAQGRAAELLEGAAASWALASLRPSHLGCRPHETP